MLQHQRHARILEIVKDRTTCTIDELREALGISPITLYRDLKKLDEASQIRRVHGGVTLREPDRVTWRYPDRLSSHAAAKQAIALEAAAWVQEGSGVFLDASSTTCYFARALAQRELSKLTVVTTAPGIPHMFEEQPQIRIISTGGELHHDLNSYGGLITMRVLEEMNFDAAYVSCAGFSLAHGATTDSPVVVEVLRGVAARSREVVLLLDSSKFSHVAMMTSLHAREITRIVTDAGAPVDVIRCIQDAGVDVTVASSGSVPPAGEPKEEPE